MTLRRKFLLYLLAVHAVFAGCAIWFLRVTPVWLIGVEVLFVVSLTLGIHLIKSIFGPLDLFRSGSSYLQESDFTTRFKPTGHLDVDQLIAVYNAMADTLREERTHNEEQEHLLRQVMDESPGSVITLDVHGNLATVNPAAEKLLRQPKEALIGCSLDDLETPLAPELAAMPPTGSRLLTLRGRSRVRCQTGTFMDRGFPHRFLLLDELTEELHQSEKQAYEKLVRMMSHEVNNTCGAVQSLLESCLSYRRQLDDTDRVDFSQAMEVAIKRTVNLNSFMRGFADVVRLPQPQVQFCNPWEIAAQVGLLYRERCGEKAITVREDFADNLPPVSCDPVQLEQVLVNVVKNAVQAIESTGRAGEIVLQGGLVNGHPFLAVNDTGPGLNAQTQDQLFTPFFTTRQQGQGIGLTMVQEILLAHGFDFSLENGRLGGAEFRIIFED